MIRHVLNLVWQRKAANALIITELLITFLILFALAAFSLNMLRLYRIPLGFNVENTLSVTIGTSTPWQESDEVQLAQVMSVLRDMEEIAAVETLSGRPFDPGSATGTVTVANQKIVVEESDATDGFPEAVGMRLLRGRWFGPQDEGQEIQPVVANQAFIDAFGGKVDVGTLIPRGRRQQRVVGVFEQFRYHGQFATVQPFVLQRQGGARYGPPTLVLVLKPDITAAFEQHLHETLQRTAPAWDFDSEAWTSLRKSQFRTYTLPLLLASAVVLFLLVMVGFGMLGVLWQNVIRRTPELGLRRAMGATAGAVRLQIVLELLAAAAFALMLGFVIVVQFPLSGMLQALDWQLFVPSVSLSALLLLTLCVAFALYPSYQATRRDPVEALRYE